jgi:cysteine desulfurase
MDIVNKIAETLKKINPKILIHVDGVQSFGKIPFAISDCIDYYSISAHKINGIKGVGALIKRKNAKLSPLIHGGGQENGLRSGTENVFGIKVFDLVTKEHYQNLQKNYEHVKMLNNMVKQGLNSDIFTIISSEKSSPYILSVSAVGLRGEVIMHSLEEKGVLVGNGSACSSKNPFSRVIQACGYDNKVLDGVLRISFSHENTIEETEYLINVLNEIAKNLKGIMKI